MLFLFTHLTVEVSIFIYSPVSGRALALTHLLTQVLKNLTDPVLNYQAPSSSLWSPPGPHYRLLSRTPTDAPSPLPARRAARRLRHGAASVPGRAALAPDAAPLSRASRPQPATMLSTLAASALGLAVHLSSAASARGRQRDGVPRGLLPGVQYAPMRGARVCMPTLERSDDGIRASLSGRNDSE